MNIARYDTDLTDSQWALLQPHLPPPKKRGRPRSDLRQILNALLYAVKAGCQWRLLPKSFPPWRTVYGYFRSWQQTRLWERLNSTLRSQLRSRMGRRSRPTGAILDSQSVKSDPHGGDVGYDAAKKIKGRKRHLLVDTLGLVLGVLVTPANVPERDGAELLLQRVLGWLHWLRVIWVDGGYCGEAFQSCVRMLRARLKIEVVKRGDSIPRFQVLPRRWVVERTFAWLMRHRRLVRDYEARPECAEAWIYIAMIRIQLRRLA
jgi:putative transposase